jgi:hypothetical protein
MPRDPVACHSFFSQCVAHKTDYRPFFALDCKNLEVETHPILIWIHMRAIRDVGKRAKYACVNRGKFPHKATGKRLLAA